MIRALMKSIAFLILTLLFSISCSSKNIRSTSDRFKVSVSSDGRTLSNFNQVLIHRVEVNKSDLNRLYKKGIQSLDSTLEKDIRGSVVGISIKSSRARKIFNLLEKDVISSIGRLKISSVKDFWNIGRVMELQGKVDITVIRNGQSLKFIYFLNG